MKTRYPIWKVRKKNKYISVYEDKDSGKSVCHTQKYFSIRNNLTKEISNTNISFVNLYPYENFKICSERYYFFNYDLCADIYDHQTVAAMLNMCKIYNCYTFLLFTVYSEYRYLYCPLTVDPEVHIKYKKEG